jgi:tRNA-Thr(GGU) m(6)t(6)A37 methyltransferase TsaA
MLDARPVLRAIGRVRSALKVLADAPRQGEEGAPGATLVIDASLRAGLTGLAPGDELIVLTWLHLARRDQLETHPRNDPHLPLAGVFSTRSPARPNPIGLHRVRLLALRAAELDAGELTPAELDVEPLEALDGTPVIDIKPVWGSAGI